MSYYDILLAKQLSGGGGSSVTVEEKNITQNGTYSETGKAYSPVNVNVPNSYSAGDEGKVVSSGALVAQTSATYDTNNTYDTTLINSVTVNVSGGSSNIVKGTFNYDTDGAHYITLPYAGSGYVINIWVYPTGGLEGNQLYSLIRQGAIHNIWVTKRNMTQVPTSSETYHYICESKKNGTSATIVSYIGGTTNQYDTINPPDVSAPQSIRLRDNTTLGIYTGSNTMSICLQTGYSYDYIIEYSS